MRPEVERYFKEHFGGIEGFIHAGRRWGVDRNSIHRACELVYDGLSQNESRIIVGQKVQGYARGLVKERRDRSEKRLELIGAMIDSLDSRILVLENAKLSNRIRRVCEAIVHWSMYG